LVLEKILKSDDFASARAARQSAQKRSAPLRLATWRTIGFVLHDGCFCASAVPIRRAALQLPRVAHAAALDCRAQRQPPLDPGHRNTSTYSEALRARALWRAARKSVTGAACVEDSLPVL
jgi:hypothetical protein